MNDVDCYFDACFFTSLASVAFVKTVLFIRFKLNAARRGLAGPIWSQCRPLPRVTQLAVPTLPTNIVYPNYKL